MPKDTCPVVEHGAVCGAPSRSPLGLCNKHRQRAARHGDPLTVLPRTRPPKIGPYFFEHVMEPSPGCRLWPFACSSDGYGSVRIGGRMRGVHSVTCEMWYGPRPPEMEAAHSCGNPPCWAGEHLRWATRTENQIDRVIDGKSAAKLTTSEVIEIRRRYAAGGILQRELAAEYGVQRPSIGKIVTHQRWTWLR